MAKGEPLSHDYPISRVDGNKRAKHVDRIPADMDFPFRSDHMQLQQAFIYLETGIHRR